MKRFFSLALAASALLTLSCSKDDATSNGRRSGEVDFSISASLPKGITTYTSNQGGVSNVDPGVYDLRYICEVWTREATPRLAYRNVQTTDNFSDEMTFSARLLAMDYDFVFWADFVVEGGDADNFYNTANALGLRDIEMTGAYGISDEARDAYYAAANVDLRVAGVSLGTVMLTRPFGKIRLVATDGVSGTLTDYPVMAGITYAASMFPGGFDALTGSVTDRTIDLSGEYLAAVTQEDVTAGGQTYTDAYVLAFDYIFASPGMESVALNIKSYSDAAASNRIGDKDISAIPVAVNKLTTVIGNLYTFEGVVTIQVDDNFADEEDVPFIEVAEASDVEAALLNNRSVKVAAEVSSDITIIIPAYASPAPEQESIEFCGGIVAGVTVTIDGDTNAYGGTVAITVPDGTNLGNLTINAGNAHVVIYGSYGQVLASTGPATLIVAEGADVNTLDVANGNVIVYGQVDNFGAIAAGSKIYWAVGTENALRDALRKDGRYNHGVILTADIASTQLPLTGSSDNQDGFYIGREKGYDPDGSFDYYAPTPYDGYLFDGNGFTISGQAYNNVMAVYAHNVTIKNLGVTQEPGMRPNGGISVYRSNNLNLRNVAITDCGKEGGLIVNASTVTATGLKTSGNWYGGVEITKGSAPAGGNRPVFTFDNTCSFGDNVMVYVRTARTGTDYTVNIPAGWSAFNAAVTPIYGGAPEAGVVYVNNTRPSTQVLTPLDFTAFQLSGDRYLPASVELLDAYEGETNVIKLTVDESSNIVNRPAAYQTQFYNTQGAGWIMQNVAGNRNWEASVKVYVSQSMIDDVNTPFRVELWTTTADPESYPLLGIGNVDASNFVTGEGARWRMWNTDATTGTDGWLNVETDPITPGWHTIAVVANGTTAEYRIDGIKIGETDAGYCIRMMLETYNFNSWSPATTLADPTMFPDYAFDAYFGEVTFKLK